MHTRQNNDTGKHRITVVTVSDDHYVILLAVLIKSIEAHLAPGTVMDMWVIADGIKPGTRSKLEATVDTTLTTLHWKKMQDVIPQGTTLPTDLSSWPLNIYMRLFIPSFLPADVRYALYLDADMIVQTDISVLWQHPPSGKNILAAVRDPRVKTFDNSWGGILNYKQLGLDGNTAYFNTGLLLIDLVQWRNNNTTEQILNCIKANTKHANYPDQYGLNIVLANRWQELDPQWNHFATILHEAPYIIHFVERKPIYATYSSQPAYLQLFYHYLALTEWKGHQPISELRRYAKKVANVLIKRYRTIFRQ